MSYKMVSIFTISMAIINEKSGEMVSKTLLAKNVDHEQAYCELENRTSSGNVFLKTVVANMVESVKKHGKAFAVFHHPTNEQVEFYISATEQMA